MEAQLTPNVVQFATLWRQLRTKLCATETRHEEHCSTRSIIDAQKTRELPVKTGVWRISYWTGRVRHVEPCGRQLRPKLPPKLGHVGAKWVRAGRKLGPCWPKLTPSGADVAAMSDRNGACGPCCADLPKCANYHSGEPAFGGSTGRACPPQLNCTSLTDLSVRIPRCHVSAPSARAGLSIYTPVYLHTHTHSYIYIYVYICIYICIYI